MKGERRLAAAVMAWWATVTDRTANETTRGKAYRAMTDECRRVADKPPALRGF